VLTIGSGNKDTKPGIAVLGGIEGNYLVGKELALGFAESLLRESDSTRIKELLNKITFNEDGPGGYDGNRDLGFNWEPNYIQSGADKYPFTFPENQAVRDFVLKHSNIAGSQSFHNSGGQILHGPSIQGGGAEVYSRVHRKLRKRIFS
jgi:hypothetical protein